MMEDVKQKFCPFLVIREYKQEFLRVLGISFVENFQLCKGKDCAAYCNGECLRLVPPALLIGNSPLRMRTDLTDAEIEKLCDEIKAPIMPTAKPAGKKPKEKVGFNSHDCEARYKCPYCGYPFGDWDLHWQPEKNGTKDYCPKCGEEFLT